MLYLLTDHYNVSDSIFTAAWKFSVELNWSVDFMLSICNPTDVQHLCCTSYHAMAKPSIFIH